MILLFIVLFIIGVCISFNGVFIVFKNTDIRIDFIGRKDFFPHLTVWEWVLSLFLIIVGGGMIYLSSAELFPYLINSFDLK